jgi:hypothetical protein
MLPHTSLDVAIIAGATELIDPRTGLVAARFRNPNPLDHHLAAAPFADVMARHLRSAGFA